MKKAFDEGWGAVICKTICLNADRIHNVTPRYGRMKAANGEVLGWENIELISDRPTEVMLAELKQLKEEYPERYSSTDCEKRTTRLIFTLPHISSCMAGMHASKCSKSARFVQAGTSQRDGLHADEGL